MTTLTDLILEFNKVFTNESANIEVVRAVMSKYTSKRKEWEKYAMFDTHSYTRNLVHEENGKFNLLVLCWNEKQGSRIHSHANSHCFMKVLEGSVREEQYDWPSKENDSASECATSGLVSKQVSTYNTNDVIYICDEIGLHKVENPSDTNKTVTLHLYYPPFQECYCFDETTGRKTKSNMTYWSKFGQRTCVGKNQAGGCARCTGVNN